MGRSDRELQPYPGGWLSDLVYPLRLEAHDLPFAHGYFDAVVCVDSYNYFGTDDLYLGYLVRYLRPGGQLGLAMAGLVEELSGQVPGHLADCWDWEYHSFHTSAWWATHFSNTGKVQVDVADLMPDGWRHWQRWEETIARAGQERWREHARGFADALARDRGRTFGIVRVVARCLPATAERSGAGGSACACGQVRAPAAC